MGLSDDAFVVLVPRTIVFVLMVSLFNLCFLHAAYSSPHILFCFLCRCIRCPLSLMSIYTCICLHSEYIYILEISVRSLCIVFYSLVHKCLCYHVDKIISRSFFVSLFLVSC